MSMRARAAGAAKAGVFQIGKSKLGEEAGWNLADFTIKGLRSALGDDADSVLELAAKHRDKAEFLGAATAHFFGEEITKRVPPKQAAIANVILRNAVEHVLSEGLEEIQRYTQETDPAKKAVFGRRFASKWKTALNQAVGDSLPTSAGTAATCTWVKFGSTKTWFVDGSPSGAYDEYIADLTRGAPGSLNMAKDRSNLVFYRLEGGELYYTEGKGTIEDALNDPRGSVHPDDWSVLHKALQEMGKGDGVSASSDAWAPLKKGEVRTVNFNSAIVGQAIDQATADEEAGRTLRPVQRLFLNHGITAEDSDEQLRDHATTALLKAVALVEYPTQKNAGESDKDFQARQDLALRMIFNAIRRAGGEASVDRRTEQGVSNALRRLRGILSGRYLEELEKILGKAAKSRAFKKVEKWGKISCASAFVGVVVWCFANFTNDFLMSAAWRGALLGLGLVLTLPLIAWLRGVGAVISVAVGDLAAPTLGVLKAWFLDRLGVEEDQKEELLRNFDRGPAFLSQLGNALGWAVSLPTVLSAMSLGFDAMNMPGLGWDIRAAVGIVFILAAAKSFAIDRIKNLFVEGMDAAMRDGLTTVRVAQILVLKPGITILVAIPILGLISVLGYVADASYDGVTMVVENERGELGIGENVYKPKSVVLGREAWNARTAKTTRYVHMKRKKTPPTFHVANTEFEERYEFSRGRLSTALRSHHRWETRPLEAKGGIVQLPTGEEFELTALWPKAIVEKTGRIAIPKEEREYYADTVPGTEGGADFLYDSNGAVRAVNRDPAEELAPGFVEAEWKAAKAVPWWVFGLMAVIFLVFGLVGYGYNRYVGVAGFAVAMAFAALIFPALL